MHECPFDNDNIFESQPIFDSLDELEEKEFYEPPPPTPVVRKGTNRQKPKRRGK